MQRERAANVWRLQIPGNREGNLYLVILRHRTPAAHFVIAEPIGVYVSCNAAFGYEVVQLVVGLRRNSALARL
ncbi:hypothetical protein ABTN76_20380, partial [Acinetobacter baumannii]